MNVLYGAGDNGLRSLYRYFDMYFADGGVIVDSNPDLWGKKVYNLEIVPPSKIVEYDYQTILMGVMNQKAQFEIIENLIKLGVDISKILPIADVDTDPIRYAFMRTQNLFLQNKQGAVAECGVFRGDFACRMNGLFYKRKLFLFDSFEGFHESDINVSELSFCNNYYYNLNRAFKQTNEQMVYKRMPFVENVVIKKGYVPETFDEEVQKEEFVFVNMDMDLYQPMFEACKFFWNRMVDGGIMLLHDYFNSHYSDNVQNAVKDFEAYLGHALIKLGIGDAKSLAIVKSR